MGRIEKFEDLICWQKARFLVKEVYSLTAAPAFKGDYDLKSQLRRASISTMNNIAEGFGRFSPKDFVRFLEISATSAMEVKSALYIVIDLAYSNPEIVNSIQTTAEDVKALNLSFIRYLNTKTPKHKHGTFKT